MDVNWKEGATQYSASIGGQNYNLALGDKMTLTGPMVRLDGLTKDQLAALIAVLEGIKAKWDA